MFQAPKLTDAGKNLYYRNMAGEGIKFTTIQLGNGTISGPISAMTALVSAVVTIDAAVKNNAEQYADVSGHFSNAELEEGFYWREIGVFAADPDYPNDRSHDILYCYQNAYDTADFIPVASVETVEKHYRAHYRGRRLHSVLHPVQVAGAGVGGGPGGARQGRERP